MMISFETFIRILVIGLYLEVIMYQMLHIYSLKRPIPENVSHLYSRRAFRRWQLCQCQISKFYIMCVTACFTFIIIFIQKLPDIILLLSSFSSVGKALLGAITEGIAEFLCFLIPACKVAIRKTGRDKGKMTE